MGATGVTGAASADDQDPREQLLRSNAAFRRLWASRLVSSFGDSLSLVALTLFVADSAGAAFAVAALLLVGDFAPSLLGPLAGAVVDRFDRRRVLLVSELIQAAAVLGIALTLPALPVLLGLVAVRAVAFQVLQPASRAAVPMLVADPHLERANSALGFGVNGTEALGPLAAAALLPVLGIRGVLLVDVATFLVSAVVLVGLRALPVDGTDDSRPGLFADSRAGLKFVAHAPWLRVLTLGFVAVVAANGIDDVALVFLAQESLDAGPSAVAFLYAAVGIGLLVGYLLLARTSGNRSMLTLFVVGCAVSSAGNLLTGVAWAVGAAFTIQLVRGMGLSAMDVGVNTLLQRGVPPELTGRVFGAVYGAVGVAAACSYLLGAGLLELTDPRVTFVVAGALGLAATAVMALALARGRPPGSARPNPCG
ncbi:MAG: MFS transporter [Nakamurella sp.]